MFLPQICNVKETSRINHSELEEKKENAMQIKATMLLIKNPKIKRKQKLTTKENLKENKKLSDNENYIKLKKKKRD